MNAIIDELREKVKSHPHNGLLKDALAHLSDLQRSASSGEPQNVSWGTVRRDFDLLEAEGLWQKSERKIKVLDELRLSMTMDGPEDDSVPAAASLDLRAEAHLKGDNTTEIIPQDASHSCILYSVDPLVLPRELVDILNHTYFLHVLATDPIKVLPPGKSLLSVLSRPRTTNGPTEDSSSLHDKVEDMVHKAFWNEAVESISNPEPSIQLARLKHLYKDLETSLTPLLPRGHAVLVTLSSHISPTSSPILSAINCLREILTSLRERCAPTRDSHIDHLLAQIIAPLQANLPAVDLAGLVVSIVKSTMELAEAMKDDLSQFFLGTMGEKQLRELIAQQARKQERDVLLGLWRPDAIQKSWSAWLGDAQSESGTDGSAHDKYISRIVQALGSTLPVSCNLPTKQIPMAGNTTPGTLADSPPNSLPPPFFFTTPPLLYIQNCLQALVIAASLRSLTRLPLASAPQPSTGDSDSDFMQRIWILLTSEISENPNQQVSGEGSTKLVNLADEVVRARTFAAHSECSSSSPGSRTTIDAAEENRLRSAVARTLQPTDPAFLLLQKRLLGALTGRLIQPMRSDSAAVIVPERMQTGRDREAERGGKRPRLMVDPEDMHRSERGQTPYREKSLVVKGFEDAVLIKAIGEALGKIRDCAGWVEETWGDLIEGGGSNSTER